MNRFISFYSCFIYIILLGGIICAGDENENENEDDIEFITADEASIVSEFHLLSVDEVAPDPSKCDDGPDFLALGIIHKIDSDRIFQNKDMSICFSKEYAGIIIKTTPAILIPYDKIVRSTVSSQGLVKLYYEGVSEPNSYFKLNQQDSNKFEETLKKELNTFMNQG